MSKKDYKKGMADAMAAYEGFGEKQEAAIQHIGKQVEKTNEAVAELGGMVGGITDYITEQEKAALYRLNTPIDIADLDAAEKRVLLAILYQLSADEEEPTEAQQNYVRAVQRYLKIHNPQTEINLEAIENVEDVSAQKAILQAVLEFYYLGTHPDTYTEDQMDFLDCFQVNRKTRREITGHIKAIVNTVGLDGLAEKYGVAEELPDLGFANYKDNGRIPASVADTCISLLSGESDVKWFRDGLYFLETTDYLFFCRNLGDDYDEKDYQFFRIAKATGRTEKIPLNIKKEFPFENSWNLSYHIQGNTIYLIENKVDRDRKEYAQLIAIDVAELSYQFMPFKFPVKDYNVPVRFHLSGDKTCLVVYAYILLNYRHSNSSGSGRPLSKVFVLDFTNGNRIFTIEPKMVVRDAFLHDGRLLLLGKKDSVTSLFRYDIKTGSETDILPQYDGAFNSPSMLMTTLGGWVNNYERGLLIERMDVIDDEYYFLIFMEKQYGFEDHRELLHLTSFKDDDGDSITTFRKKLYTDRTFGNSTPIIPVGDCMLRCGDKAEFFDPSTDKTVYLDSASNYILLGDYLYRRKNSMWYKTNISLGIENLQWEIVVNND